jgi:hypothetical protein
MTSTRQCTPSRRRTPVRLRFRHADLGVAQGWIRRGRADVVPTLEGFGGRDRPAEPCALQPLRRSGERLMRLFSPHAIGERLAAPERYRMKTAVIVAPHFPPSNLAGVHRARLLSQHLAEFGWRPIIVTTHWRYYEETLDWGLASLVDPALEVVPTAALPTRPIRTIGDIGVRALPWHLAALKRLRREKRMDFLLLTVPSFFSAVLGQLMWREAPLPFGIDYIDPWVNLWPEAEVKYSKAWASYELANRLEPWAVRNARLITAVAPGYFEGVLERNPHLRRSAVTVAAPYGFSTRDFAAPSVAKKSPVMFDPCDGRLHFVYAGALLPKAVSVLERLLEGLTALATRNPSLAARIRLHFIGTGKSANDSGSYNVRPLAERLGLAALVDEHPHRMGYLDVLAHLTKAHAVLIVGSTESHYTPSKVYQSVQSRRPVLALLHERSTAVDVVRRSGAGLVITLSESRLPQSEEIAAALEYVATAPFNADQIDWGAFDAFSARETARVIAAAMTEAVERWRRI